jgi:hypothetical protein
VTRDSLQLPAARSWRDIPQPVVPRAMSREGRWRLTMAVVRSTFVVLVCAAALWTVWYVAMSMQDNTGTPLKAAVLKTDGVLDDAWLARALALPKHSSLVQLDLEQLRSRLLADGQIVSATLTRDFPDRLVVQVTERVPIARVMLESAGQQHVFVVARDGVVYDGKGYDEATIALLPWLDGVEIVPEGHGFRPIAGMAEAAELLGKARLEAEHLYLTWAVISLARLETDHQIEVRTKNGPCLIRFSTRDDYFRQLVKLNYVWDQITRVPDAKATIDLSLGQDVPVMVENPESSGPGQPSHPGVVPGRSVAHEAALSLTRPVPVASQSALFHLPYSQPNQKKREL